jgi:hypothetical protein
VGLHHHVAGSHFVTDIQTAEGALERLLFSQEQGDGNGCLRMVVNERARFLVGWEFYTCVKMRKKKGSMCWGIILKNCDT